MRTQRCVREGVIGRVISFNFIGCLLFCIKHYCFHFAACTKCEQIHLSVYLKWFCVDGEWSGCKRNDDANHLCVRCPSLASLTRKMDASARTYHTDVCICENHRRATSSSSVDFFYYWTHASLCKVDGGDGNALREWNRSIEENELHTSVRHFSRMASHRCVCVCVFVYHVHAEVKAKYRIYRVALE